MTGGPPSKKHSQPGLFEEDYSASDSKRKRVCAVMHCDGASSGNPGNAGIGVVIDIPNNDPQGKETYTISEYIGIATNNVAEYSAFIKGLEKVQSLGILNIKVYLDSELIVRQINGVYKVKNKNLIPLFNKASQILDFFESYTVEHVRRDLNKEADALATQGAKNRAG